MLEFIVNVCILILSYSLVIYMKKSLNKNALLCLIHLCFSMIKHVRTCHLFGHGFSNSRSYETCMIFTGDKNVFVNTKKNFVVQDHNIFH